MPEEYFYGEGDPKPKKPTAKTPQTPVQPTVPEWDPSGKTVSDPSGIKKIPDLRPLSLAIKNVVNTPEEPYQSSMVDYKTAKAEQMKKVEAARAEESRLTKELSPVFDNIAKSIFGAKGEKVAGFTIKNASGNAEPDLEKIDQAIDSFNEMYGGDGRTKSLISAHAKNKLMELIIQKEASTVMAKKGVGLGEIDSEEDFDKKIKDIATAASVAAKNNADQVYASRNRKAAELAKRYQSDIAPVVETYKGAREVLAEEYIDTKRQELINAATEFEETQNTLVESGQISYEQSRKNIQSHRDDIQAFFSDQKRVNEELNNFVNNEFESRYGEDFAKEVAPFLQNYLDGMRKINTESKTEFDRIQKASKISLSNQIQALEQDRFAKSMDKMALMKESMDEVMKNREIKDVAYREMLPFGQVFTKNFASYLGGTAKNLGSFLNSVNFGGYVADWLRGTGASMETENQIRQKDLTLTNWMMPDMMAQGLGQLLGQQGPQVSAAVLTGIITRNPALTARVAGAMGTANNIVTMAGDTYNQILDNGGNVSDAVLGANKMIKAELALMPLEMFSASSAVNLFLKKGIGKKIGLATARAGTEYVQEKAENAAQTAIVDKNTDFLNNFFSGSQNQEALQAAYSSLLFGGLTSAAGALKKKPSIPAAGNQWAADLIQRKGVEYANMVLEFQYQEGNISEDELMQGKEKLKLIESQVKDAQALGMDKDKTQLFIGVSGEIKDLEEQMATVADANVKKVLEKKVQEKQKELEEVISSDKPAANIVLPTGGSIALTEDNAEKLMSDPDGQKLMQAGMMDIVGDEKLQEKKASFEPAKVENAEPSQVPEEKVQDMIAVLQANSGSFKGLIGEATREEMQDPEKVADIARTIMSQVADDPNTGRKIFGDAVVDFVEGKTDDKKKLDEEPGRDEQTTTLDSQESARADEMPVRSESAQIDNPKRSEFVSKLEDKDTGDFAIYSKLPSKEKKKIKLDAIARKVIQAHKDGIISDEDYDTISDRVDNNYKELKINQSVEGYKIQQIKEQRSLKAQPEQKDALKTARSLDEMDTPTDKVLQYFVNGGKINRDAVGEMFGGKDDRIRQKTSLNEERKSRFGMTDKSAPSIKELAHQLWESDKTGLYTDQDFRNAIEDVLGSHSTQETMAEALVEKYVEANVDSDDAQIKEHGYVKQILKHIDGMPKSEQAALVALMRQFQDQYGFIDWQKLDDETNGFNPEILSLSESTQKFLYGTIAKNLQTGKGEPGNTADKSGSSDSKALPKFGQAAKGQAELRPEDFENPQKVLDKIAEFFKDSPEIQRSIAFVRRIVASNRRIKIDTSVRNFDAGEYQGRKLDANALGYGMPDGTVLLNFDALAGDPAALLSTALHEMVHGATRYEISNNAAFREELNDILAQIREKFKVPNNQMLIAALHQAGVIDNDLYGTTNEHEMIAEIFSNQRFFNMVKGIEYKGASLLQRIFQKIAAWFSKKYKIVLDAKKGISANNIADYLMDLTERVVKSSQAEIAGAPLPSFVGAKANLSAEQKLNLEKAKEMTDAGRSKEEVFDETGWFVDAYDKNWKTELPDSSKYIGGKLEEGKIYSLDKVLDYPELFESHPDLKNIKVVPIFTNLNGLYGAFNNATNILYLNKDNSEYTNHRTILHEIQHAIQHREGFARGGSPDPDGRERMERFYQQATATLRTIRQSISNLVMEEIPDTDKIAALERQRDSLEFMVKEIETDPTRAALYFYQGMPGETEATNVERRIRERSKRPFETRPKYIDEVVQAGYDAKGGISQSRRVHKEPMSFRDLFKKRIAAERKAGKEIKINQGYIIDYLKEQGVFLSPARINKVFSILKTLTSTDRVGDKLNTAIEQIDELVEAQLNDDAISQDQERIDSFREYIKEKYRNEKMISAKIKNIQNDVVDHFKKHGVSLSHKRVVAVLKQLANLADLRNPVETLEGVIDAVNSIVLEQNNADNIKSVKAAIKKVKKVAKGTNITQKDSNFLRRLNFPLPSKVLNLLGPKGLELYLDLVEGIAFAYSTKQGIRVLPKEAIEYALDALNNKIANTEQQRLEDKIDRLIVAGELPHGTTVEEYLPAMLEEQKSDKGGFEQYLRSIIPDLQGALEGNDYGDNQQIADELREMDISEMDIPGLKQLNNVLNNILNDGDFDASEGILAKYKDANHNLKELSKPENDLKVRQLNAWGSILTGKVANLKTFTNMVSSLLYNDKARATFRRILFGKLDHKLSKSRVEVDRATKEITALYKKYGLKKESDYRLSVYAFLNQHQGNPEESFRQRLDKLITDGVERLYAEGAKKGKSPKKKAMMKQAEETAKALKSLGLIGDYQIADRSISVTRNEATGFVNDLSAGEQAVYNYSQDKYNSLVDRVEQVARNVYGLDFQRWDNYFPMIAKTMAEPDKATKETEVADKMEIFGDFDKKISKQPSDRLKKRGQLAGSDKYYQMGFLDVFLNGYNQSVISANAGRNLVAMASTANSAQFGKFLGGAFNKEFFGEEDSFDENKRVFREKLTDVVADKLHAPFMYNSDREWHKKIIHGVMNWVVKTWLARIDQLALQYGPNWTATMVETGVPATVKATSLQISSAFDKEVRAAYDQFLSNFTGQFRSAMGMEAFDEQLKRFDQTGFLHKAGNFLDMVNLPGTAALKVADRGANNVTIISAYIKYLVDNGIISSASEFDIAKEGENPNPDAMAYAEQVSARVNNESDKANRASVVKNKDGSLLTYMWLLKGYNLNSYQEFANSMKVAFDKRSDTEEKKEAAKHALTYATQIIAFNTLKVFLIQKAYSAVASALLPAMFGIEPAEESDEEKRKRNEKKLAKLAASIVADGALGGVPQPIEEGFKVGANKLYGFVQGQIGEEKDGVLSKSFKPYFVGDNSLGGTAMLVDAGKKVVEAFQSSENKAYSAEVNAAKDKVDIAQLAALALRSGDLLRLSGAIETELNKKKKKKSKGNAWGGW